MKNIEDYILASKNMENISDGGSAAFSFDDGTVLICYGQRENEELIMEEANKKRAKGVRTPYHLAISRPKAEEFDTTCWVLQEKAKGKCFTYYSAARNDSKTQLKRQEALLNAPDYHYEKCIADICEIFNMGLELKAKNVFYDESIEDGGFTFIDLIGYDSTPLNPNSIEDILLLTKYISFIYNIPRISAWKGAPEEHIERSDLMYYKMWQKVFMAIEKVIPNFDQHRRWVLRSYPNDVLEFFQDNGTSIGNLSLTEQEYDEFDQRIELIIERALQNLMSGKFEFWDICANKIRIDLEYMGLKDAWKYHIENEQSSDNFDSDWDYDRYCEQVLLKNIVSLFIDRIILLAGNTTNPYLLKAKDTIDMQNLKQGKKI